MTEENKTFKEEFEDKKDALQEAIEEKFKQIQRQNLLLGAQVSSQVILDKIAMWEQQPGKRTLNDHKRLIKDIKKFCETSVSKKVNPDGTVDSIEDNNTKLTEGTDESNINESDN